MVKPMRIKFTKMQGLGNDFVVVDAISERVKINSDIARQLADRHFGVGCDQVLVVMAPNITADLLKSYRDMGIDRCIIGVGMENWDKPEIVMPMIEQFSKLIPEL